jgi:DNA modification methylase
MFAIHHSDCIGLQDLDISIDLTVTSPPYFNAKEYVSYNSYEEYLDILKKVFQAVFDKTNDGRMCCVNISNIIVARKSRNHESSRIPLVFHFSNIMEAIGWKFIEDIIWVKPEGSSKNRNGGFFQHRQPVAYKPNVINEYILVFQKPSLRLIDSIVRRYDAVTAESSMVLGEYDRTNVWQMNPEVKSKHPAPFPEMLAEKLIRYYSFVGDMVFDPYMGSGTTAVAAKKLGRNCVGFEIHAEYIAFALQRLETTPSFQSANTLEVPDLSGEKLREWLQKKPKRFLLALCSSNKTRRKEDLVSELYEKFSSSH